MGSLGLMPNNLSYFNRKYGKELSRFEFKDNDGVPVSITLNLDDQGLLYELDIWKVNFSKVLSYPNEFNV